MKKALLCLCVASLVASCSSSDSTPPAASGGTGGVAGTSGAGMAGAPDSGAGGSAGTAGQGGSAGTGGSAGEAGAGGAAGSGGGAGEAGAAGMSGTGGAGGEAGMDGGVDASANANGEPCNVANECVSGFCADGVCCATKCDGVCEACDLAVPGVCAPLPAGTNPDNECTGGAAVCDGARACADGTRIGSVLVVAQGPEIRALQPTPNGAVAVGGSFMGTGNFGATALGPATGQDLMVGNVSPGMNVNWLHTYGATGNQNANAIARDGLGNLAVAGQFQGALDFGQGQLASGSGQNGFVAQLDSLGSPAWSKPILGTGQVFLYTVAADSNGGILLAGTFYGNLSFGSSVSFTGPNQGDGEEIFLLKLSSTGAFDWAKQFSPPLQAYVGHVEYDSDGSFLAAGRFGGTLDLGGGTMTAKDTDLWVARFGASGDLVWGKQFGGANTGFFGEAAWDAKIAPDKSIVVAGEFEGAFDLGSFHVDSQGDTSGLLTRLSPDGTVQAVKTLAGTGQRRFLKLSMDSHGDIIVAGDFDATVDCGNGVALTSAGPRSMFLAKYSPNFTCLWSRSFTGTSYVSPTAVTVGTDDHVWAAGRFNENLVTEGQTTNGNGFVNGFLMRYAP